MAHGFHGVPNLQVVVLYPGGKVSRFQEAQMATLGGNVRALKVPGVFDDCQRLVKTAFCDESLAWLHLSSANSINVGRLLPQSVYYFHALLSVPHEAAGPSLLETIFSVPSGNLGNLTAGVIAQRMGLPAARFLAACNVNDVLPEFLRTGTYRARPSVATASNAMDVGNPSNFVRLAALHGDSIEEMKANLAGYRVDEAETRATIREVYRRTGYVLDPHGAVGYAAALRYRAETGDRRPIVTLATAHPAKFADVLREELGFEPALPAEYTGWESRPILAQALSDTRYETFREWLEGLGRAGEPGPTFGGPAARDRESTFRSRSVSGATESRSRSAYGQRACPTVTDPSRRRRRRRPQRVSITCATVSFCSGTHPPGFLPSAWRA